MLHVPTGRDTWCGTARSAEAVGKRAGPVDRVLASTPTGPFHSRPPNTAPDPAPDPAPPDPMSDEHHQLAADASPVRPQHAPLLKLAATLESHPATVLVDSGATTNFLDRAYVRAPPPTDGDHEPGTHHHTRRQHQAHART